MKYFALRNCKHEFKMEGRRIRPVNKDVNFFIHVRSEEDHNQIFNWIAPSIYDQLVDYMNINTNFSIYFNQAEGTTTDFVIIHGHTFNGVREMKHWLNSLGSVWHGRKYRIIDFDTKQVKDFE